MGAGRARGSEGRCTVKRKVCVDCKEAQPLDAFYRKHKGEEERQARCKPCDNRKRVGSHTRYGRRPGCPSSTVIEAVRGPDGEITLTRRQRRAS